MPEESDEEKVLKEMADSIKKRKLETPAIFLLEAHKPLSFLASQALIGLTPILYPFFGEKVERYQKFLNSRENIEKLIRLIEKPT